jgi:rare lipoprotein A
MVKKIIFYSFFLYFLNLLIIPTVSAQSATFYSDYFIGRKMANGQRFSQGRMTAAHPTIRLGSTVKVVNRRTGKSIRVVITDRCNCSIDLSKTAFQALGGKLSQGRIPVKIIR